TEVFTAAGNGAFKVFTVAATHAPVLSQGVLKVQPDYSVEDAPTPDILVLPGGNARAFIRSEVGMAWVKKVTAKNELSMSVCTGAFILAQLGRLDGRPDDPLGCDPPDEVGVPQGPGEDRRPLRGRRAHRHHRRRVRGHRRGAPRRAASPRRRRGVGDRAVHAVRLGAEEVRVAQRYVEGGTPGAGVPGGRPCGDPALGPGGQRSEGCRGAVATRTGPPRARRHEGSDRDAPVRGVARRPTAAHAGGARPGTDLE